MNGTIRTIICSLIVCSTIALFTTHAQQVQQDMQQPSPMQILVGSEPDYPPYCFVDENGNAAGFSVELFKAAAAAMKIDVDITVGLWNEIKHQLAEGTIDALPLVGRTPEREKLFDFTIPYLSLYGGIIVHKNNTDIAGLPDLQGKRVVVMKGDNAEEFLRREKRDFEIVTTPTFKDAMEMLSEMRCDAVVIQRLVGLRIIQKEGFADLKVLDEPIYEFRQDFCFAVQEGNKDLLALLNEGLALVMADGTFRRLQTAWFAATELPFRKIIVGGDHNYPPFEFLDGNGRPAGYNTELTRAIAREMGLEIEIRLGPWPKIMGMLERGEIDAVQGMFYSSEREKKYDFSPPHTVNHCVVVSRAGKKATKPNSVEDLRGKRIVVQEGDIMHDFALEKGLKKNLVVVDTQEEALQLLSSGQYDYALAARLTALYLIEKNGWSNLTIGNKSLASHEYSYAVKNDNWSLLSHFSEGLAVLEDTGEYRRIYDKWLGVYEPAQLSFGDVFRYGAMVVGPLLALLGAFFLWTRSLRKQVAERTASLRESEEFQKAIIACSPVALYSIDVAGKVYVWNESAERVFGWEADEIVGKPLPIVPDDKQEEFTRLRNRIMEQGAFSGVELTRRRKDGTRFPVSLSAAPIRSSEGQIIGIIGAAEDITERKKAEEELRKHRDHLEELVEEKTSELKKRVAELERFHEATIDREIRMKELRDEIETLKKKLGRSG